MQALPHHRELHLTAIPLQGFDHPVVAVRDMESGRATYERLGFTVPPRGSHIEWGTGNWCIMFEHDYLELRGVVDGTRYLHHLDDFLARREGLMGVAFSTDDAQLAFRRAQEAGLRPREPRSLTRRFELPEGETRPSFQLVFLEPEDTPGMQGVLMIEHLTPELLRRPQWLEHPNGAVQVASMTVMVDEPAALQGGYSRLFGNCSLSDGALQVDVGRGGRLCFLAPAAARREGLAIEGFGTPLMCAMALAVADTDRTARVLTANGVPWIRSDGGAVRVAAEHACGVIVDFVQSAT